MSIDPWVIDFPCGAGFYIKAVDGVFNLFRDAKYMNNVNYPYVSSNEYADDMKKIDNMMIDGPL